MDGSKYYTIANSTINQQTINQMTEITTITLLASDKSSQVIKFTEAFFKNHKGQTCTGQELLNKAITIGQDVLGYRFLKAIIS